MKKFMITYILNGPGQNKQFFLNTPHIVGGIMFYKHICSLTLKMPSTLVADTILIIFILILRVNKPYHFMWIVC